LTGTRTDAAPRIFFEQVYGAFQRAEHGMGAPIQRDYAIDGFVVRLRFAGPALVPLITPALAHLEMPPDARRAALTICLWDSASTHTLMPPRPWAQDACRARGDVRGFNDTRSRTALAADVGAVSVLDLQENLGVYWIRAAEQLPTYERGAPLRVMLHWWMRERNRFLIHAGAVGLDDRGVLLIGKGGSGKSTACVAAALAGWQYVADDYCLLASNGEPYVHSLYNSAKLDDAALKNFPALVSVVRNPSERAAEKALLDLAQVPAAQLTRRLPLCALVLPRVTGQRDTRLAPIAPSQALRALAPSSLFQLPGTGPAEFFALANLAQQTPCYYLEAGTELSQIPQTLQAELFL